MTPTASPTALLVICALAVLGLVVLVARFKLHAFLALILASLFVGLGAGMNPAAVAQAFQEGVGKTLGFIAVVVGLGTMLGKLLAESGGAGVIARWFIAVCGAERLPWALLLAGFVVGLPVFFGVGLVLLAPILFTLVRETRRPLLSLALPLVAGLSASHGLVPPHPGPMVAMAQLNAKVGTTILYSILIGLPAAAVAGLLTARWAGPRMQIEPGPLSERLTAGVPPGKAPGFGIAIFTILLPVVLMLVASLAEVALPPDDPARRWAALIGSPLVALLVAVLAGLFTFGIRCGFGSREILRFTEECLGPAASIILVVGAGGGFSKVLDASGADEAIAGLVTELRVSPLVLGWLAAALIRVAVGSATVAITMGSAIMAPVAVALPGTNVELLVIALGAGSLVLSHLNDGGFWFVKEYLNLSVPQTLQTWSVLETILSLTALVLALLFDLWL